MLSAKQFYGFWGWKTESRCFGLHRPFLNLVNFHTEIGISDIQKMLCLSCAMYASNFSSQARIIKKVCVIMMKDNAIFTVQFSSFSFSYLVVVSLYLFIVELRINGLTNCKEMYDWWYRPLSNPVYRPLSIAYDQFQK